MKKEESMRPVPQQQEKFREACSYYRNFRLKGLIFSIISLVVMLIALCIPTIKVSGEEFYKKYVIYLRSEYLMAENGGSNSSSGNNQEFTAIRKKTTQFTLAIMVGGEEDGKSDEEKAALLVVLSSALLDADYFEMLFKLNYSDFKDELAEKAKEFAPLSTTYSMYEMGKLVWKESMLYSAFSGEKETPCIFANELVTIMGYAAFYPTLVLTVVTVAMHAALCFFADRVVKAAYVRKSDVTRKNSKKRKCFNQPTIGWFFYIVTIICYFISKSASLLKKPCATFYASLALSPVFYVMLGLEAVVWVLSLINGRSAGEAYNKISSLL